MIHNEAEKIKTALSTGTGTENVVRGWPKTLEVLPCIAVAKAADTPVRYADGAEYIAELEYYIRVFAGTAAEADALAEQVEEEMTKLGYARTFSYDEDEGETRIEVLRYRKYV